MKRERAKARTVKRIRANDPNPNDTPDPEVNTPEDEEKGERKPSRVSAPRNRDPLPMAWSRPGKNQRQLGYRRIPQRFTEAIELALSKHGMDGKGKNGLPGYFYHLARTDPKAMAHLIGRIMPTKVQTSIDPQSALGQTLEAVRSRIAFEKARTINGTAVQLPNGKGS